MKKAIQFLVLVSALAAVHPASAKGLGAELTGGKAEGQWGAELGLIYALDLGAFALRPAAGAFLYQGDNDRYRLDDVGNGQRCRDLTNGQFAANEKCGNTAAMFYAKMEAVVAIGGSGEVGVGGRYMDGEVRPYGLVAMLVAPKLKVVASAGDRYFAGGLRLGF